MQCRTFSRFLLVELLQTDDDEESNDVSSPVHSIPLRSRYEPAATQRKLGEEVTNASTQCLESDICTVSKQNMRWKQHLSM